MRQNPVLKKIAKKYKKSVVQIMLNWGINRGHVVIPKSSGLSHQKENLDIFDFKLTDAEMETIKQLDTGKRLCNKFPTINGIDFFS